MWIFSRKGFFSVVEDAQDPSRLVVRARVAADLDALRADVPDLSPTITTPARDYPYRAFCSRDGMAAGLAKQVLEIDYANFKREVERVQGLPRERLYAQVWSVMSSAEARLGAPEVAPAWPPAELAPKAATRKPARPRRARR